MVGARRSGLGVDRRSDHAIVANPILRDSSFKDKRGERLFVQYKGEVGRKCKGSGKGVVKLWQLRKLDTVVSPRDQQSWHP